jgi:hypothetical protein
MNSISIFDTDLLSHPPNVCLTPSADTPCSVNKSSHGLNRQFIVAFHPNYINRPFLILLVLSCTFPNSIYMNHPTPSLLLCVSHCGCIMIALQMTNICVQNIHPTHFLFNYLPAYLHVRMNCLSVAMGRRRLVISILSSVQNMKRVIRIDFGWMHSVSLQIVYYALMIHNRFLRLS